MKNKMIITRNSNETEKLGEKMGENLKGGEILALVGDLGGGKTTFVRGLAKGLGCKEIPKSPSFVLMNIYNCPNRLKLVHLDLYRLESDGEIESVGVEDYLGKKDCVSVIEWAEKGKEIIPKNAVWIRFEYVNKNKRKIEINYDLRN